MKVCMFDIDGVLSIPKYKVNDKFIPGGNEEWWTKYNIGRTGTYDYCKISSTIIDFMEQLKKDNVIIKCLTAEGFADAYFNKVDFILDKYSAYFHSYRDIIFVPKAQDKIPYMLAYAENLNYKHEEIMLVDDTFTTILEASEQGFLTKHISEFLI